MKTEVQSQLARLHRKQFLEAMEAYQASMKNPKLKKLDLREKHSWDEVMQVAKEAETAYLQAGEKGFRKLSRIVTAKSPAALPFTRLIPEEYYGTVLAGGLRLVFGVRPRFPFSGGCDEALRRHFLALATDDVRVWKPFYAYRKPFSTRRAVLRISLKIRPSRIAL